MTIIKGSLDLLSLSLNAPMILRVAVSLKYPNPYDNFALSLLKVSKFQMQIIFYSFPPKNEQKSFSNSALAI